MAKLIWIDLALEDLDGIGNYIAQNSERFAKLTIKQIYDKTELLKQFPKLGRVVPEKKNENIRELILGTYRIVYEIVSDDLIYVLFVHHNARNLKP